VCEDGAIDVDSSSRMMIVTLAQRLVIVTLPQRIVMMTLAQRLVMFACLREMMTPCVVDRQMDGQDDSPCVSADTSHTIDDLTPQQSGDTSEESHVLAPRDDELPMGVVTHLSPLQTPMIATSHEEISGTSGMMDEPIVRDAHHGQVDPQIQEEVQDVPTVTAVNVGDITDMSRHFPKFSPCRNIRLKMSRHFRHFECVATHSLTRDIFSMCRESMECVGLLKIFY
jgi:hypothetical protein